MLDGIKMAARYAWGLNGYLLHTLTPAECRRMLEDQLRSRERSFLSIAERGIYSNPRSPYLKLLRHAGVEYGDLAALVRESGVEGSLDRLYDAGVHVRLDEFKRRVPVARPGLEFAPGPHDFDNPLLSAQYSSRTSGSRGNVTRVIMDLDLLEHDAACHHFMLEAFEVGERPFGIWREVPPVTTGMNILLRLTKLGKRVEKWFSTSRVKISPGSLQFAFFTYYTVLASRVLRRPLPAPEYTPLENAAEVARWLARKKSEGTPAFFDTQASAAVKVCIAAAGERLDISGTCFCIGGEPYTKGKADVITGAGCRAIPRYSMAELGNIGMGCAAPGELDDVHLLTDKIAVIQRRKILGEGDLDVGALVYTTILPSSPKLMLNVESDDYGVLEDRSCGCAVGEAGFTKHLSGIRSYEKLTSGGVTFLGTELLRLVEEVLPQR
ncbi:MAG TPA: hypothetical protein VHC46_01630, partial [Thermodesulfobacteriota bacterium]|nr:hypothetical protein [Thermodesulfobacteriota bacterium]